MRKLRKEKDYTHPREGTETLIPFATRLKRWSIILIPARGRKRRDCDGSETFRYRIILIPARGRKRHPADGRADGELIILIPARGRKRRVSSRSLKRELDYTHPREGTETGESDRKRHADVRLYSSPRGDGNVLITKNGTG